MSRLGVVGNISIDCSRRAGIPDQISIGGAALHVALAAARSGLPARPISVVDTDLGSILHNRQFDILDLSGVRTVAGRSASFTLNYDTNGVLIDTQADYGVSTLLTTHALEQIRTRSDSFYHVCCRRPLDIGTVLGVLLRAAIPFSLDFFLPSALESVMAAAEALPLAHMVFVNTTEYDLLTRVVPAHALREVVVTDGPHTTRLIRAGRYVAQAIPPRVTTIDVTGAGDTLAGTVLGARAAGLDDVVALEWAVRAASARVASPAAPFDR